MPDPRRYLLVLAALLVANALQANPGQVIDITQASAPPVLDGYIDEWDRLVWHRFAPGTPDVSSNAIWSLADDGPTEPPGTAGTAADLSGSFALQWDRDWIYLAAQITDNVHDVAKGQPSEWWVRDSVALFLDVPLDGDGASWIPGDHAFAFTADPTYPEHAIWWRHGQQFLQSETTAPAPTQMRVQLGAGGDYILEAAIPMALLTGETPDWKPPFIDRQIGFMLLITDPDGGLEDFGGQLVFGGDNDDDSYWARLRFVDSPSSPDPATLVPVEGRATYQHDGSPWAGGRVHLSAQGRRTLFSATTTAAGRYQIQVPPGVYSLNAGPTTATIAASREGDNQFDLVVPPTYARFSCALPADRRTAFTAAYHNSLAPLLHKYGFRPAQHQGRSLTDTLFHQLLVLSSATDLAWHKSALQKDPAWNAALQRLANDLQLPSLFDYRIDIYQTLAGPGQTRTAGPGQRRTSQGRAIQAGTGLWQGPWFNLSVPDGLPNPYVHAIMQDRSGHLWVGLANGGAVRYDGRNWTLFDAEDGLPHNAITAIVQNREGALWFGAAHWSTQWVKGGLTHFADGTFTTYTHADGLPHDEIYALLQDPRAPLWIGTGNGLARFDGETFTTYSAADGLPHNIITALQQDSQGRLWVGTDNGLSQYDGETFTAYSTADGLPHQRINTLLVDSAGQLWAGTDNGLGRFDGETFTAYSTADGLPHNTITALQQDSQGRLWVGTDNGLSQYDGKGFTSYAAADPVAPQISTIFEDREGNLWFGTQTGGLSRYSGDQLTVFTTVDGLADDRIYAWLEDRNGHMWFATQQGVSRFDGQIFTTYRAPGALSDDRATCLLEDRDGHIWIGTQQGLNRFDGRTFSHYSVRDGLPHDQVHALFEDDNGHLWIGTATGVSRFDGTHFTSYNYGDGLPSHWVDQFLQVSGGPLWLLARSTALHFLVRFEDGVFTTVQEDFADFHFGLLDSRDQLWVSWGDGLWRHDGDRDTTFTDAHGLASNVVYSIAEDSRGQMWFGTDEGISRYDGETFVNYTTQDGLANNEVVYIIQDRSDNIWLVTRGGGISRFDGTVFQPLLKQDGLPSNFVIGIHQDRRGDLWIATWEGLARYRPRSTPPPVFLTGIAADRHYAPTEAIHLPSSQDLLSFEFQGISFKTRPGQMLYLYRLEGYHDDWRQTRTNRVEYSDLPRGQYRFQVKAVDRDLTYSTEAAAIAIDIHLPYERIAWIAALGLAGLLLIGQAGRLLQRDRRLQHSNQALSEANTDLHQAREAAEAANRAKSQFLANMSHELRTPLNGVLGYAQILRREGGLSAKQARGVDIIKRSGDHLLTLINDILDLARIEAGRQEIEPQAFDLPAFLQAVVDPIQLRAEAKGLDFSYRPAADLPETVLGDERRLRQILLNLLGNAVKFTEQGQVQFTAKYSDPEAQRLRFCIEDSGPGIATDQLEKIFEPFHQIDAPGQKREGTGLGLSISRELAQLMDADLKVQSSSTQGSLFTFDIHLPASAEATQTEGQTTATPPHQMAKAAKILIVDDEETNRAVLRDLLGPLGYTLEEAADGQACLDRTAAAYPDLILLDLVMPVLDGWETARRLRQMSGLAQVPIIALTASAFPQDQQKSLDAGCSDFLPKPVQSDQLLAKIAHYLGHQATAIDPVAETPTGPLIYPPLADLTALRDLAQRGQIVELRQYLDRLASAYGPFVEVMRPLATNFDMEGIGALIDQAAS